MTTVAPRPSEETRTRVARAAGDLGKAAVRQMEADHEWFRALSAENRSWVGLVAQAGISSFLEWFAGDQARPAVTADVFGTAPRELTRSISLGQTLDLIRTVIGVVEREIADLAAPGEGALAREAVLRYSREVAFAAAEVYAEAAEARGAWDARLESLVVDAVIRGEADESRRLAGAFGFVWRNWWEIMRRRKKLTALTASYDQAATLFPFIVAAPRFFAKEIQLGGLMQISNAFGRVQDSFSWFVGAYVSLAAQVRHVV